MDTSEELVWHQIQLKNIKVFENYYKEHYKTFFLASYNYVQSRNVAQEIVNDVFIKIWKDAEAISIESSLKAYIYKAVINRSINALNKQKKETLNQKALAYMQIESYEIRHMETNELKVQLYKTIDALPDQCRKVFQMSRIDGMKQQEIADKLGISIKTVKNHITHALRQLRNVTGKTALLFLSFLSFFSFIVGLFKIFRVL